MAGDIWSRLQLEGFMLGRRLNSALPTALHLFSCCCGKTPLEVCRKSMGFGGEPGFACACQCCVSLGEALGVTEPHEPWREDSRPTGSSEGLGRHVFANC